MLMILEMPGQDGTWGRLSFTEEKRKEWENRVAGWDREERREGDCDWDIK